MDQSMNEDAAVVPVACAVDGCSKQTVAAAAAAPKKCLRDTASVLDCWHGRGRETPRCRGASPSTATSSACIPNPEGQINSHYYCRSATSKCVNNDAYF